MNYNAFIMEVESFVHEVTMKFKDFIINTACFMKNRIITCYQNVLKVTDWITKIISCLFHRNTNWNSNESINESISHITKTAVKSIYKILKIYFLQFTNMRLLLTAKKLAGSNTYFDVTYRESFFTNWFFKRSLVC